MKCLIIGKVWPEPNSSAAGRRIEDIIRALLGEGCSLHVASAAQRGEHALDLEALGVASSEIAVNDASFDSWLIELAPDVVIFDRFMAEEQFGWRVARHCPEALRVLDTSDLHCLRMAREAALRKGGALCLKNETALREVASIYRSDLSIMIADYEIELLQKEFGLPAELLAYWPLSVVLPDTQVAPGPSFSERAHFMMIGSFLHAPNLDAARWCCREIWPRVAEALPEVELHLYGSYGERYAGELHCPRKRIYFKGRAGDAVATMAQYRINLAPLRFGAGLKGKVFDGFLSGTPTVMSPIAAEGITKEKSWIHNEPEAFAAEAIALYSNKVEWNTRREEADQLCRERFVQKHWYPRLDPLLREAMESMADRREANFTGRMLAHHHHRSTEFMSRWIEAKNRGLAEATHGRRGSLGAGDTK